MTMELLNAYMQARKVANPHWPSFCPDAQSGLKCRKTGTKHGRQRIAISNAAPTALKAVQNVGAYLVAVSVIPVADWQNLAGVDLRYNHS